MVMIVVEVMVVKKVEGVVSPKDYINLWVASFATVAKGMVTRMTVWDKQRDEQGQQTNFA